jgi:outer membrane protein OmpA-like peptidoglycan-associated protein
MKKLIYFLIFPFLVGCFESSSNKNIENKKNQQTELVEETIDVNKKDKANKEKKESKEFKPDWSKPFMSPYGKPIINIIRAYFMVGEFQIVKKFIVNSDCFDDTEFDYLLRNCSWGYEIDATNMKWQSDSTFLMTAKTNKNQSIGMEKYLGKIVNDTAKIFLFTQNKKNPFVFYNKNPPADIQCQIESLARTINFEYNSSILTEDSKINLKALHKLVSKYSNLKFLINGHTSSEGSDNLNMKLSLNRAKAVRLFLISLGINKSNLKSNGFGSTTPIYPDSNIELRSKNRRVEIIISNQ